ncbi:TfdA family taurine catabolism dioxygenase TauD [Sodiomyces alkalinus F11]|uniref:TfdA family taurine catabolism dioxygenase TauD n=1 Tax=Sodiomyces alkalinus (strain CBS 110278 / VKM F-3762 / F11) TaxID=1314773 RepID=A0A3N2PXM0_SODAK|nr:TfdA family taurine catabolism dioxygenase TauD [Sodiomyces alkalinus F11]ROT39095.1 TfdA family taurine catabolism dioxygenase TauD [Sodiomyces alkalinus F11]
MAPSATETPQTAAESVQPTVVEASEVQEEQLPELRTGHKEPLQLSGALDKYEHFEVTPVIGREYVDVNLVELLRAPNSDELLPGVVFFREQDDVTNDIQKELVQRLGELSGNPATSKLHIHPINNAGRGDDKDDEISVISSVRQKELYLDCFLNYTKKQSQKTQWHSDITFEPIPSDYALLRLTQLPKTGGAPLQKFLETLTATYAQPGFNRAAERNEFQIYSGERGAPENVGEVLEAIHPVIRTNPVTGWKSVFAVGHHVQKINGLRDDESKHFLDWFVRLVVDNHDLQVRYKWQNANDPGLGEKQGARSVSLGERPYFDPQSTSRREALRDQAIALVREKGIEALQV